MVNLKTTFHAHSLAEFISFDRSNHSAALLKATPESVGALRQTFKDWTNKHELDFGCIRSKDSPDTLIQGAPYHLPHSLRNHIDELVRSYFKITTAHHAQVEIGRKRRTAHIHPFAVITQTVNGAGTWFETSEGKIFAQEADIVFMPVGLNHGSTDFQNDSRNVIAVFDAHTR